jgi:mannose-6-phosphate isomerase-like protein (cupin superfamily)
VRTPLIGPIVPGNPGIWICPCSANGCIIYLQIIDSASKTHRHEQSKAIEESTKKRELIEKKGWGQSMEMFHDDIKTLANANTSFRKVLSTAPHSQLVVMSLQPNQDIGEEILFADQTIFVLQGHGEITMEGMTADFEAEELLLVPGGTNHNLRSAEDDTTKLAIIYAPAQYSQHAEHRTKADALVSEADAASQEFKAAQREFVRTRTRLLAKERI